MVNIALVGTSVRVVDEHGNFGEGRTIPEARKDYEESTDFRALSELDDLAGQWDDQD